MLRASPGRPLSYAFPAALKPWVSVHCHPHNACVTPMAARSTHASHWAAQSLLRPAGIRRIATCRPRQVLRIKTKKQGIQNRIQHMIPLATQTVSAPRVVTSGLVLHLRRLKVILNDVPHQSDFTAGRCGSLSVGGEISMLTVRTGLRILSSRMTDCTSVAFSISKMAGQ
jgi:hypothetical protein